MVYLPHVCSVIVDRIRDASQCMRPTPTEFARNLHRCTGLRKVEEIVMNTFKIKHFFFGFYKSEIAINT
jgi:hypothetical protein